jgi:hypothetical protein
VKTGPSGPSVINIKIIQKSVDESISISIMRTSSLTGSFSGQPFFNKQTNNRRV